MTRRRPDGLFSVTAWGAAALLAVAASAGPVRAECGDYVHVGAAAAHDSTPKPPAEPCHGPDCALRKHAPAPLAPATPPAEPNPADAILTADPPADPNRSARIISPSVHLPAGPASAIFHPPRHS